MKRLFYFFSVLLLVGCVSSENSSEFIQNTEGRYLFNSDEALEIYFVEKELKVKWRGQDMTPLKVSDSAFYLKEMNEKLVFISTPEMHIELAPKREHDNQKFSFIKLGKGLKTPSEYLASKEYDKALQGYMAIKKKDSLDPTIREWTLNRLGYNKIRENKFKEAIEIFKINVALYPHKSNPYDSLGEAYWRMKDTANAVASYKKALSINPENRSVKRFFRKHKLE
jgi:tetratricopeptide (TPR) repeat protein